MPTTTTNFFIDCGTIEEVKNRYRDFAKKYHPDLGGDTATMQFINAEYSDAMRRAIPSEENEYRREQANAGFEPLREAIKFAVTPRICELSSTIKTFIGTHKKEF